MAAQARERGRGWSRNISAEGGTLLGQGRARRLFFRLWATLPGAVQARLMRWGARKVTVGACAVIEDGQGRVLVAHHRYRRQPWALPGGLVGRHEQPAAALARELREELDVDAEIGALLHMEIAPGGHMTLYYAARVDAVPCPDGVEIDRCRYMAPITLRALFGGTAPSWLQMLDRSRATSPGVAA